MRLLVVFLFFISIYGARGQMFGGNWMPNLFNNINRMNNDLQDNLMNMNEQIQANVRQSVHQSLRNANKQIQDNVYQGVIRQNNIMKMNARIQDDVNRHVDHMVDHVRRASALAAEEEGQRTNTGTVESVSFNSIPGGSRSVISGYAADGQPYYRESEDKVIGSTLYHTDRIYNPSSNIGNEFRYTVNLTDPNARPVLQEN